MFSWGSCLIAWSRWGPLEIFLCLRQLIPTLSPFIRSSKVLGTASCEFFFEDSGKQIGLLLKSSRCWLGILIFIVCLFGFKNFELCLGKLLFPHLYSKLWIWSSLFSVVLLWFYFVHFKLLVSVEYIFVQGVAVGLKYLFSSGGITCCLNTTYWIICFCSGLKCYPIIHWVSLFAFLFYCGRVHVTQIKSYPFLYDQYLEALLWERMTCINIKCHKGGEGKNGRLSYLLPGDPVPFVLLLYSECSLVC